MSTSISVVVCAYTTARWQLLQEAIESILAQERAPHEIVLCIDHNEELAAMARDLWGDDQRVRVIENRYPGRLGSARNSALELLSGEIVAFLDDDARADPDWLSRLSEVYAGNPDVQAVGCAPTPAFETARPSWFPVEFDWVFGCTYRGLPTRRAPTRRLIGAAMTVRRAAALAVGGFHSDNHDDMDLSHRLVDRYGPAAVIFEPTIRVSHFVTAERVKWAYFWRRCFNVNRGKVLAFRDMEQAGNLSADIGFVASALLGGVPRHLASGTRGRARRAAATIAGIALAGLGNLAGRLDLLRGVTEPAPTRGLAGAPAAPEPVHT
ncbi:MAG: glycosyltransferase [Solirubrobacteraceae bacterium]